MTKKTKLPPELLQEARGWISDCIGTWRDIHSKEDIEALTPNEIEKGIEIHYSGGLEGFISACAALIVERNNS
ncbi:MAG: peptide ABC transporter substrate-binding protein [Cyanobacteria bacterium P01_D01_bin.116]